MNSRFILPFFFCTLASLAEACSEPNQRQFDFWLGEWTVYKTDGTVAGNNVIRLRENGCVLHEHYTTPSGYEGESLNIFDKSRNVWHQTWVDNQGTLLLLEGAFKDGAMVLQGMADIAPGKRRMNRISWTANSDGSVRQHWQFQDESGTWQTLFDGLYRRTAKP